MLYRIISIFIFDFEKKKNLLNPPHQLSKISSRCGGLLSIILFSLLKIAPTSKLQQFRLLPMEFASS